MTHITAEIKKWGNSFGLIIPKTIIKDLEINEHDVVDIEILRKQKVSGFGIAKGAKPLGSRDKDDLHEI